MIFVSAFAHVAFMVLLPAFDGAHDHEARYDIIDIEMDLPATTDAEVVPEVAPPVPQLAGTYVPNVAPERVPNIDVPQITPEVGPATTQPTVLTVQDNPSTTEQAFAPTTGIRLDPRAAALASLGQSGPVTLAPQAQEGPSETTAERDARLGQELSSHLREFANFQAHLTTRPTPTPRTLPDGRISFEGVGLTLIFDPRSGEVSFTDRPGFQYEGLGGGAAQRQGVSFNFDLNDGMHRRHGSDPRAAERRWLTNRTQAFRDSAQDTAVASQTETASRSVRGRLQRILDDETRPMSARRARIFMTWDQCSESDAGASARRSIIAFIREHMPAGSEAGFSAGEIASMNGRRQSTEAFAPY